MLYEVITLILAFSTESEKSVLLTAKVQRGDFQVKVYSSGQIESENKESIPVPAKLSDRSLP